MSSANDIVICEPLRTPVGRFLGALAPLTATDLATTVLRELVEGGRIHLDRVNAIGLETGVVVSHIGTREFKRQTNFRIRA